MQVEIIKNKEEPSSKRILVVDDDETIRQLMDATLTSEGFKVKTARDGRGILQIVGSFPPHLIITDLMMPGGGGYELLRVLQADPATSKTPVLIISGANLDNSTKAMMQQEPNVKGFIEKPLHPYSLMVKIHQLLNTKTKEEKMIEEHLEDMKKFEPRKFDF